MVPGKKSKNKNKPHQENVKLFFTPFWVWQRVWLISIFQVLRHARRFSHSLKAQRPQNSEQPFSPFIAKECHRVSLFIDVAPVFCTLQSAQPNTTYCLSIHKPKRQVACSLRRFCQKMILGRDRAQALVAIVVGQCSKPWLVDGYRGWYQPM